MLLGMLSNYNKYESRNPYLTRLQKCKQTKSLENIISMYTILFTSLRSRYIQLYDDEETLSKSVVNYMSRWFSSAAPTMPSEAENIETLASLPSAQTALLLPLYDLIHTNSYFVNTIIRMCTHVDEETKDTPQNKITFLTSLLSFSSYLFQNNRNDRTGFYSRLLLIIILRFMEESSVMNYMAREGSTAIVRICRQVSVLSKSSGC